MEMFNKFMDILLYITPVMAIISVIIKEILGVGEYSFVSKTYSQFDMHTLLKARILFQTIKENQWTKINPIVYTAKNQDWDKFTNTHEDLLFLYNMSYKK